MKTTTKTITKSITNKKEIIEIIIENPNISTKEVLEIGL
jgi:hypothetical protein